MEMIRQTDEQIYPSYKKATLQAKKVAYNTINCQ